MSTKQLLEVSSVNTLWNYEARCVLRDIKKRIIVIDGKSPCLRAKTLNDSLGSLNVRFFSGLRVTIERHKCVVSLCHKIVEDAYGNLLATPLRYLEVRWSSYMTGNCILGQLILRLISRSLTLEHLVIREMHPRVELKDENRPEGAFELPRLTTIQLPEEHFQRFPELLPSLLARAPNVEELVEHFYPLLVLLLPTDALKIVRKLHIHSYSYAYVDASTHEETMRSLDLLCASDVKLRTLVAEGEFFPRVKNQRMTDYLQRFISIVSSSSETLTEMKLDSWSLYESVRANLFPPVMKNVKDMTFDIYNGTDSGITRYLLKLPLAQIFPRVVSVKLSTISGEEDVDPDDDEVFLWPQVKKVRLEYSVCSDLVVKELGTLFPNLCCLEVSFLVEYRASPSVFPFRQIWSSLPFLEKLTVRGKLATVDENFDAEFWGIYLEEAALLRNKDEEFLKTVNIVPPFAPITHMKSKIE